MSTLKTNACQLGQSATASNNFTWYQPTVPDGTVRLGQGNSGATTSDILVASSSGLFIGGSTVPASRIVQGTAQTTSGANAYGYTSIPSWVKRITLSFQGCRSSSTGEYLGMQIGSGSYTASGYGYTMTSLSNAAATINSSASSANILCSLTSTATRASSGICILTLVGSNLWTFTQTATDPNGGITYLGAAYVTLGGALDRIQIFISGGVQTFTAGTVNIIYEG